MIVGIDVGSETHYASVFDWRNYEYTKKPLEFSNTEAGFITFKAWVDDIAEKQGKTAVIPGMGPSGHYWFALGKFLQDRIVGRNIHHRRFAAVDGWVYTRPCRTKKMTFYFVYSKPSIFVPDTYETSG